MRRAIFWRWIAGAALLGLLVVLLTGHIAERRATTRLAAFARSDGQLRRALLTSEIQRLRLLPIALSGDSDLAAALWGSRTGRAALNAKLESLAATTGAAAIYALNAKGRAIAASNWREPRSFVGEDYSFRPYYREAARTGAAMQFALGTVSRRPGLYFTQRSHSGGYIVVKLEFDRLEAAWARAGGTTFATNAAGIILVTSRADWRYATLRPLPPAERARNRAALQSGPASLAPLPLVVDRVVEGGRRAHVANAAGERLLWVMLPATGGLRLNLLVPTRSGIEASVRTAQAAALAATLALLGLLWALAERHRRREERAASAIARTAELETLVEARTAELRREIGERAASEERADTLREGLRQANRLATLGQITASVAHETAQPVAAIRAYAANCERFLARGQTDAALSNLSAIGRLTERIGAITAELRGFARKGGGAVAPMPLATAIDGARLILRERLSRTAFTAPDIPPDLMVLADSVRLEQVLVNLLQNAVEATGAVPDPAITLALGVEADIVRLTVADNGPGIDPAVADRLFTPFVTSRPTGLGLGLVISQDIMADLGGALRLLPSPAGAVFEVALRRAP